MGIGLAWSSKVERIQTLEHDRNSLNENAKLNVKYKEDEKTARIGIEILFHKDVVQSSHSGLEEVKFYMDFDFSLTASLPHASDSDEYRQALCLPFVASRCIHGCDETEMAAERLSNES
ncbi:hypothetical protein Nepgr_013923 [Nepenthes gracilis]|uniref:Uncharacterized protein n=1 Tax=Nepenthes gracilis TaxID=150966 RepID=A0AAD3SJ79_NEPGR|nr:hypothetical protein Nepgr_013923 [Nepenthes gracilis]